MRYTFQKIGIVVFSIISLLPITVGVTLVLEDASPFVFFTTLTIAFSLVLICAVVSWRKVNCYQTQTYDWYIKTKPRSFRGGRVFCDICDSTKIHTKNLFNKTFTREHFCGQCGKTLYYSPESN